MGSKKWERQGKAVQFALKSSPLIGKSDMEVGREKKTGPGKINELTTKKKEPIMLGGFGLSFEKRETVRT